MGANVLDNVLPDWAKNALDDIGRQWNAAKGNKTLQDNLHAAAETIRAQFGYSGGVDGSKISMLTNGVLNTFNVATGGGSTSTAGTVAGAVAVLDPTTSTGVPAVVTGTSGVTEVQNSGNYALLPSPMTPEFQRILTLGLGVLALGFIAKMFKGGR